MKHNIKSRIEAEKLAVPVGQWDHIEGPENARITLLEYGDYECPYCGMAYRVIKKLQKRLADRMRFVFRNFPLTNVHPHAERAAEAAEAAGVQGRFWEMHDILYEHQHALEDEDLAEYAAALDLDVPRLMSEAEAGAHTERIREDFKSGIRSGVNGTPTFFINDIRYDGSYDLDSMVIELLEAE